LTRLRVRQTVLDSVTAHARAAAPMECCGLLIGSSDLIDESWPARNLRDSPTRFLIRPRDHFDALRVARRTGRAVRGAYHSHPHGPRHPSPTDAAEMHDRLLLQMIVSLEQNRPEVRMFEWTNGNFARVDFVPQP
jgi:proteasome lid subunit RPN8/RPN11